MPFERLRLSSPVGPSDVDWLGRVLLGEIEPHLSGQQGDVVLAFVADTYNEPHDVSMPVPPSLLICNYYPAGNYASARTAIREFEQVGSGSTDACLTDKLEEWLSSWLLTDLAGCACSAAVSNGYVGGLDAEIRRRNEDETYKLRFPIVVVGCQARTLFLVDTTAVKRSHPFRRGDVDGDGLPTLTDALKILEHLYNGNTPLPCQSSADVNDDGELSLEDPVRLLNHLFRGQTEIVYPYESEAFDETDDALSCLRPDGFRWESFQLLTEPVPTN